MNSGGGGCGGGGGKGGGGGANAVKGTGPDGRTMRPGDWVCPNCNTTNFCKRSTCVKCGASVEGVERFSMRPGDWICPACGDLVFKSKSSCKLCGAPKPLDESVPAPAPGVVTGNFQPAANFQPASFGDGG